MATARPDTPLAGVLQRSWPSTARWGNRGRRPRNVSVASRGRGGLEERLRWRCSRRATCLPGAARHEGVIGSGWSGVRETRDATAFLPFLAANDAITVPVLCSVTRRMISTPGVVVICMITVPLRMSGQVGRRLRSRPATRVIWSRGAHRRLPGRVGISRVAMVTWYGPPNHARPFQCTWLSSISKMILSVSVMPCVSGNP